MLESAGLSSAALANGRFLLMPVKIETLAHAAAAVDAHYLIRDPRPGRTQAIIRLQ
jgi:hypothetical protein